MNHSFIMEQFEYLTINGWIYFSENPNKEIVAQKANPCLQYTNSKNTIISFMANRESDSFILKIAETEGHNFNYLGIKTTSLQALMEVINNRKDDIKAENYFETYMVLQHDFEVSILAWEQWESNY